MGELPKMAAAINNYRIMPRIIVGVYLSFFIYAWLYIVNWFMQFDWATLPDDQIVGTAAAAAVAGFPAIILKVLTEVLKVLVLSYWNGSSAQGDGH